MAPSGVNSFLSDSCTPPPVVSTNLVDFVRPAPCACFMKIGVSPAQWQEKIRSGLAWASAATCAVKSVAPSLGHSSLTTCSSIPYFFMIARKAAQRQAHAGGDGAGHGVHLVLQRELAEALDGILGARLFLDDQLDLAAEDAAGRVDALGGPLHAAQAGLAHRRQHAGLRGQHAELHRRGLCQ